MITSNVVLHVLFTFFSLESLWPNWNSPIDSSRLAGYQALVTHVAFPSIGKHHHLGFIISCIFFCGCAHAVAHMTHVAVREQLARTGFSFLPCEYQGWNSYCQLCSIHRYLLSRLTNPGLFPSHPRVGDQTEVLTPAWQVLYGFSCLPRVTHPDIFLCDRYQTH